MPEPAEKDEGARTGNPVTRRGEEKDGSRPREKSGRARLEKAMTEATTEIMLPSKWVAPEEWSAWALQARPEWSEEHVKAAAKAFRKYQTGKRATRPGMAAWEQAWRSWVRRQRTETLRVRVKVNWWQSASGIECKAHSMGMIQREGEIFPVFKSRVLDALGPGPWNRRGG